MSHARKQIRDAVINQLTGLLTTGANVFSSRMYPPDNLPCLLVNTNEEDVQPGTIGDIYERFLDVVIRGYAKESIGLDDALDQIALEVELAMAEIDRAQLTKIEVDFDDATNKPVGMVALTYKFRYFTAASDPATLI